MRLQRTLIALSILLVAGHTEAASREEFYRSRKSLDFDSLHLSRLVVEVVGIRRTVQQGTLTIDYVESLKLGRGTAISVGGRTSPTLMGQLASGTPEDPAGEVAGVFTWAGEELKSVEIKALTMRLVNADTSTMLWDSPIVIAAGSSVFLTSAGLSMPERTISGSLSVTIPEARLEHVKLSWGDLPITSAMTGSLQGRVDLAANAMTIGSAALVATKTTADLTNNVRLTAFVPDHVITSGLLELQGLQIALAPGVPLKVSASSVSIRKAALSYAPFPDSTVAAVGVVHGKSLSSTLASPLGDASHLVVPPPVITSLVVTPDASAVRERLNVLTDVEPSDYLIPTGLETVKYFRLSALADFYGVAGGVTQAPNPSINPSSEAQSAPPNSGSGAGSSFCLAIERATVVYSGTFGRDLTCQPTPPDLLTDRRLQVISSNTIMFIPFPGGLGTGAGAIAETGFLRALTTLVGRPANAGRIAGEVISELHPAFGRGVARGVEVSVKTAVRIAPKLVNEAVDSEVQDAVKDSGLIDGFTVRLKQLARELFTDPLLVERRLAAMAVIQATAPLRWLDRQKALADSRHHEESQRQIAINAAHEKAEQQSRAASAAALEAHADGMKAVEEAIGGLQDRSTGSKAGTGSGSSLDGASAPCKGTVSGGSGRPTTGSTQDTNRIDLCTAVPTGALTPPPRPTPTPIQLIER